MATQQAWDDRKKIVDLFQRLQHHVEIFKKRFEEIEKFKTDVLDDPARKAEMKKLIDEDPDWTLTKIKDKYDELKSIRNFLETL